MTLNDLIRYNHLHYVTLYSFYFRARCVQINEDKLAYYYCRQEDSAVSVDFSDV